MKIIVFTVAMSFLGLNLADKMQANVNEAKLKHFENIERVVNGE